MEFNLLKKIFVGVERFMLMKLKNININKILISLLLFNGSTFLFQGCANKKVDIQINKSVDYWIEKINKDLNNEEYNILKTDFISFSNEHKHSKFLIKTSKKIIDELIKKNEYEEVIYYIDNHMKKYSDKDNEDYLDYVLINTRFHLLNLPNRLQNKHIELLEATIKFEKKYPESKYLKYILNINNKLKIKLKYFNLNIANLYKRIGKDRAYLYYLDKFNKSDVKLTENNKEIVPFYRYIFEGDGSATWIRFFVPEVDNIVSKDFEGEEI